MRRMVTHSNRGGSPLCTRRRLWSLIRRSLGGSACVFTLLVLSFSPGCAADEGTVDLVQPAFLKKSDLLGKSWYYRRTVVDAPENGGYFGLLSVGTGDVGTLERVRFEIQEDHLIAYRDYELIPGAEREEFETGSFRGEPVVAFPVEKHFDVIFDFNPGTGERTNVLREDSAERHWWEREYMRVDWSTTVIGGNDPFLLPVDFFDGGGEGGLEWVHPDDAPNPHHARLTPELGFMDVVVNHTVQPDIFRCFNLEFRFDSFDCGAGEVRVRHAFMEIDVEKNRGYEPLYYPDSIALKNDLGQETLDPETGEVLRENIFDRFGYFRLDRLTYDDERGLTESGRLYRAIRFDIWDRSLDNSGVRIPYEQRQVQPIVYYTNWDFPAELKDAAYEVAAEWNEAFRATVARLQNKTLGEVPDVFILRENSCNMAGLSEYLMRHPQFEAKAAEAVGRPLSEDDLDHWCSSVEYYSTLAYQDALLKGGVPELQPFVWEQNGDPRFNMMYWINRRTPTAWSGYGPMLGDPLSGRNVVSSAYVMGAAIDAQATAALEYVDFINGDLELFDLLAGENVPNLFANGDYDPRATTQTVEQVRERADRKPSQAYINDLKQRFEALGGDYRSLMVPVDNSAHFSERLMRLRGSQLERDYLTRPEDLILASQGQWLVGQPVDDALWDTASYITQNHVLRERFDATKRLMEEHAMCPMTMDLDGALVGLAESLKGLSHEEKWQRLRASIFKGVMLHEVGHNVGLRHNFEGSYDALNYHPEFWEIEEALQGDARGKELASQSEFMTSSVMDYLGKVNGRFRGLAPYDRAAVKFGYGQIVETFADPAVNGGRTLKDFRFFNDYRDLAFEDPDNGEAAYFPTPDAINQREDVIFDWNDPESLTAEAIAALDQREVPYMFCPDFYANRTPTCRQFDFGANQREIQESGYIRYKNYFLFTNFLRNRLRISRGATFRSFRSFRETRTTYQYFYLYNAKFDNFLDSDLGEDMAQAVSSGLNAMSEVIAMPTPGTYIRCEEDDGAGGTDVMYYSGGFLDFDPNVDPNVAVGPEGESCDMNRQAVIDLDDARPLFLGFSDDFYNFTFTYLGTYWDKINAIDVMTDPAATYFRENQEEDIRTFSVSFYRLFTKEVTDILMV